MANRHRSKSGRQADGVVPPGEIVPNDYYVRNPDKKMRVFPVEPEAVILGAVPVTHLGGRNRPECESCTTYPVAMEDFFAAWTGRGRGANGKYWVTTSDGGVLAIEEQYTP